jgi:hypothetical protein
MQIATKCIVRWTKESHNAAAAASAEDAAHVTIRGRHTYES